MENVYKYIRRCNTSQNVSESESLFSDSIVFKKYKSLIIIQYNLLHRNQNYTNLSLFAVVAKIIRTLVISPAKKWFNSQLFLSFTVVCQ